MRDRYRERGRETEGERIPKRGREKKFVRERERERQEEKVEGENIG